MRYVYAFVSHSNVLGPFASSWDPRLVNIKTYYIGIGRAHDFSILNLELFNFQCQSIC